MCCSTLYVLPCISAYRNLSQHWPKKSTESILQILTYPLEYWRVLVPDPVASLLLGLSVPACCRTLLPEDDAPPLVLPTLPELTPASMTGI